ncbi:50S ribosomal protein L6 [Candidatus Desantisbacteria bacterium CG_4_10_14_0_8_um_filter_48_22]|uniref:Large ribosomal subunit protein uL6 n=1 Tax=Candidatus Desantisbacteria bacterium CG_4_10_14_0_8_um_filter_48_22 TaxID=1974543 RepID=A0A2M7S9G2_9BACT|nr:ribosomal protein L6 [uncultured bacterium]OIO03457.1 MAG: 50S ribosomal protein L6 [Candidatus Desantisbacteria bacterium CG1_02_49_89]PIV54667.1 MAG: 50S ribosomal protein L6 [Candidatus Desantisbacteria bacterium CG02_land_8_20_14_3_00_49_13]PIZ16167.1 MAG: 50S ribosomal protein L6 [Candidatus Desantisbacteria bacterium CG_4_10_14_0_8_um_filter_48_22]PJB27606.1 MAG: 50S ribosomal protein L6 [Candidatus Desantisbacteria bacterium CG_4_9_14_3_um_filter_50_7]
MSRLGKRPVDIPGGVKVEVQGSLVKIEGPRGKIERIFSPRMKISKQDNRILVERQSDEKIDKSLHGLTRRLILNMVTGVIKEFERKLEINGLGYKAQVQSDKLILQIGFTHPVPILIPQGIKITVQENKISVKGVDKETVGQVAGLIRSIKPAEPYKGKGIRYSDEIVRRKAGKAVVKTAGP